MDVRTVVESVFVSREAPESPKVSLDWTYRWIRNICDRFRTEPNGNTKYIDRQ